MNGLLQRLKGFWASRSQENAFRLDGAVPLGVAFTNSIQHILAMFIGNIAPILIIFASVGAKTGVNVDPEIISNGLRSAIFMAGIGMLIQLYPIGGKIGAKLPIVLGSSFTFLGILTIVGATKGLGVMFVSIIIGGLIIVPLGLFAHKWIKLIKPVVRAMVVIGLGLSLLSVGVKDFIAVDLAMAPNQQGQMIYDFGIAWPYLLVAFITLTAYVLWQVFVRGRHQSLALLVAMGVGFLAACCFIPYNNMVDFSVFQFNGVSDFINVPRPIFTLLSMRWEDFDIGSILIVLLIYIVSTVESIGGISGLTAASFGRAPTDQEIRGMVITNGLSASFCGFFGTAPNATYAQNIGIVNQTGIKNRFALLPAALILILASFFTPLASFLRCIPSCVLAGTMIGLFGSIAIIGMQMLAEAGFTKKNVLIASISVCLGFGLTVIHGFTESAGLYEQNVFNYIVALTSNPVANCFVLSLILSFAIPDSFNDPPKEKKLDV